MGCDVWLVAPHVSQTTAATSSPEASAQGVAALAQRKLQSAFGSWAALASASFAERARQLRALRAAVTFEAGWRQRRALDCWRVHAEGSRTRRQLLRRAAARLAARR